MRTWSVGFVLLLAVLLACGGEEGECGPRTGVVTQVIDGDTVVLQDGERIRYLLADAPETTRGHHDCFGEEAAAFNRSLVEGRTVRLRDGEACTDRFGRRLAYVSVEGHDVNALLVERGYACTLFVSPAGGSRRGEFEALEVEARRARRGLWGRCPAPCPKGRRPAASALRQRVRHRQLQLPVQRPRGRVARRDEVQRVALEPHVEGVTHGQPQLEPLLLEHRVEVGRRREPADDLPRALDEPGQRLHGAGLLQVRARAELRRHRDAPGGGQLVGHRGQLTPQVQGRGLGHRLRRRVQHGHVVQRERLDDPVRHERHVRAVPARAVPARRVQEHPASLTELAVLAEDARHLASAAQEQRHLRQVERQALVASGHEDAHRLHHLPDAAHVPPTQGLQRIHRLGEGHDQSLPFRSDPRGCVHDGGCLGAVPASCPSVLRSANAMTRFLPSVFLSSFAHVPDGTQRHAQAFHGRLPPPRVPSQR
ncbi:hypothetical protein D7V93_40970, partial [Corallococcus llansteffanensis]